MQHLKEDQSEMKKKISNKEECQIPKQTLSGHAKQTIDANLRSNASPLSRAKTIVDT
jgi:hypothetical protein